MATILRREKFEQDGVSFVFLRSEHAIAIAVEALPSTAVCDVSARLVSRLRIEGVIGEDDMVGVAFRGTKIPDDLQRRSLVKTYVYLATEDLQDSALANAETFLDEVESIIPEAIAIATFRRGDVNK